VPKHLNKQNSETEAKKINENYTINVEALSEQAETAAVPYVFHRFFFLFFFIKRSGYLVMQPVSND